MFLLNERAFDRVWHDGLLFKLRRSLPHHYFALLKSYFNEGTFFVKIGGSHSTIGSIKEQACRRVLVPILYTIYFGDMGENGNVTMYAYADPIAFVAIANSPEEVAATLQDQLNYVYRWMNS